MGRGMGPEVESGSSSGDPGSYTARPGPPLLPADARDDRGTGDRRVLNSWSRPCLARLLIPFNSPGHPGVMGKAWRAVVNTRPHGGGQGV